MLEAVFWLCDQNPILGKGPVRISAGTLTILTEAYCDSPQSLHVNIEIRASKYATTASFHTLPRSTFIYHRNIRDCMT